MNKLTRLSIVGLFIIGTGSLFAQQGQGQLEEAEIVIVKTDELRFHQLPETLRKYLSFP